MGKETGLWLARGVSLSEEQSGGVRHNEEWKFNVCPGTGVCDGEDVRQQEVVCVVDG